MTYPDVREGVTRVLDFLLLLVSLLAIISLIAEYGFYLSPSQEMLIHRINVIIVWYFVLQSLLRLLLVSHRWTYFKSHWFEYLIVLLILSETVVFVRHTGLGIVRQFLSGKGVVQITKIYIIAFQVTILLSLLSHSPVLNQKIASYRFHPAQILMGSFLVIILIGTGLLLLPRAVAPGRTLSPLNALFTATSATCVTGLVVVDTGTHFSRLGQLIILGLIQLGGLGLMTYASFFTLILRRSISLREKSLLRDMLNYENIGLISRLLTSTVVFTFLIEAFGAVLLFLGFSGMPLPLGERIYSAIFHSVSAFCNAGFSLYSTSFMGFQENYLVVLTLATLIILGGVGFPVLVNLLGKWDAHFAPGRRWLSVQTRLVLGISGVLLIVGTLFVLYAENQGVLAGLSWPHKILNAFFQSVTTRTAGFNTVDISMLTAPTVLLFLMLMFIGASPGSTGGGIKTTTIGILFAGVFSVIKGRNRIELFHRNIPFTVLNRALVILIFSITFVFVSILILSFTEDLPLLDIIFEEFSAFGTVGLSRGITPFLSEIGKWVIIVSMFFGRLGALTISLAITAPREIYHYDYPSENVMVG